MTGDCGGSAQTLPALRPMRREIYGGHSKGAGMSAKPNAPIIIKRKKVIVGGGHHGGAWKVAIVTIVLSCRFSAPAMG